MGICNLADDGGCSQTSQQSSLHVRDCSRGYTAWTGGGWAHSPGGLRCWALKWRRCDHQSELSGVCLWGSPISSCKVWYSGPEYQVSFHHFHGGDCAECWAEINKQLSDVGVVIFSVCELWVEGSGDGVLWGSVGLESKLMRVQTGWYVVFDVLKNQFLKVIHQGGSRLN